MHLSNEFSKFTLAKVMIVEYRLDFELHYIVITLHRHYVTQDLYTITTDLKAIKSAL